MHLIDDTFPLISTALVLILTSSAALSVLSKAEASFRHCDVAFEANTSYPPLPPSTGADIEGEMGVLIHLLFGRAVIEIDDCLYEVDRALSVDFTDLDQIEILFELDSSNSVADGTEGVFVSESGTTHFELWPAEEPQLSYSLEATMVGGLDFELALPGQEAPVSPVIRVEPTSGTPEPK